MLAVQSKVLWNPDFGVFNLYILERFLIYGGLVLLGIDGHNLERASDGGRCSASANSTGRSATW